ncbi:hypothetical protein, conserved [Plasmodium gonderi]|uniref:Uncharacterized protein n=1 Tax=Plasmodium gonderi TaxID=77519 RepID=A0A1Y1JC46_PLAGO|nr:hypothetical protein, conserved [Plasmodium gonderi]GAW78935.1 hypothetical protein, conserved [Plasmodium gonderi]
MPLGVPLRKYLFIVSTSFLCMAMGSCCVHLIMKPEMKEYDISKHLENRNSAIQEVQQEIIKRKSSTYSKSN